MSINADGSKFCPETNCPVRSIVRPLKWQTDDDGDFFVITPIGEYHVFSLEGGGFAAELWHGPQAMGDPMQLGFTNDHEEGKRWCWGHWLNLISAQLQAT